jgi:Holliday junction resolvase RusA-like endonuclease
MILLGISYQKGNTLRRSKHKAVYHEPKYTKSFNDMVTQAKLLRGKTIEGDVTMVATIYYKTRAFDLDDSMLCDVLEKAGVIKNDRQIVEKHLTKRFDKNNPRIEVEVCEI